MQIYWARQEPALIHVQITEGGGIAKCFSVDSLFN
jgi:hypothetical protein